MARGFAKCATAGQYSLETVYSRFEPGNEWEWWAKAIKPGSGLPEFTGRASSLENAKKAAMASMVLVINPEWIDIGPDLDLPEFG
jgi:hypothetical protein